MQIDADVRLAAAAGGAARFLADAAGLENKAISQLQSSIVAACREAFEHLTKADPHLEIVFSLFPDRIVVVLSHHREASSPAGVSSTAAFNVRTASTGGVPKVFAGIERVQYETHGAEAVTRLTKFIGKVRPRR